MYLLIDTAFDCCQVGLWHDNSIIDSLSVTGEARHDVILAPLVAQLLQQNHKKIADLTGVAVITGPGRFTSLRVGIAFARAMVLPHHIPLIGIPTGDILQQVTQAVRPAWLVIVKRGEVFVQTPVMLQPVMVTLADLSSWLSDNNHDGVTVIGAGVPTLWSEIVPATIPCQILESLPLTVMGQAAQTRFDEPPAASIPVRPFYGKSTGAWVV